MSLQHPSLQARSLDRSKEAAPNAGAAASGADEKIVHVHERPRGEGGKAPKADGDSDWLSAGVGDEDERRWVLSQAWNQVASGDVGEGLAVAHWVHRIGIEKLKDGGLMIGAGQVGLDDGDREFIHGEDGGVWRGMPSSGT